MLGKRPLCGFLRDRYVKKVGNHFSKEKEKNNHLANETARNTHRDTDKERETHTHTHTHSPLFLDPWFALGFVK